LLGVRAFLLTQSARAHFLELAPHLLDGLREVGQLACDRRYVLTLCQCESDSMELAAGKEVSLGLAGNVARSARGIPEKTRRRKPRSDGKRRGARPADRRPVLVVEGNGYGLAGPDSCDQFIPQPHLLQRGGKRRPLRSLGAAQIFAEELRAAFRRCADWACVSGALSWGAPLDANCSSRAPYTGIVGVGQRSGMSSDADVPATKGRECVCGD
jgi:hypothetical protein